MCEGCAEQAHRGPDPGTRLWRTAARTLVLAFGAPSQPVPPPSAAQGVGRSVVIEERWRCIDCRFEIRLLVSRPSLF